jgi:hypothetical protein
MSTENDLENDFKKDFKHQALKKDDMKILLFFIEADFAKAKDIEIEEKDIPIAAKIIQKRIDALNLPIKFTQRALLAVICFVDSPGEAVILLVDALTKYEGKTVTLTDLIDLYPMGFYDENSVGKYIDILKARKIKWSEIY